MNDGNDNNKIDMVYLWCDGNDPEFIKRKEYYQSNGAVKDVTKITGDVRFYDNEELKYSLRSLEMYAPWINHVYIVTDRQVPKWLDTSYEKVTVIDHSQIMPNECIPCFNSNVIEYYLANIPELNDKFLYGNDDCFFGNFVVPADFFDGNKPVIRLIKSTWLDRLIFSFKKVTGRKREIGPMENAKSLLAVEYGRLDDFKTHHNIDAYSKKLVLNALRKYDAEFKATSMYRFRNRKCIHRLIFSLDALYSGNAVLKIVPTFDGVSKTFTWLKSGEVFSYFGKEYHVDRVRSVLKRNKAKLFCLNASEKATKEIKETSKRFMEELFPEPSKFELK